YGLLPTAIGPALCLRDITDAVGEHRAHVVGRDLVQARFVVLILEFLGLLQRELVGQRRVDGARVSLGERGHALIAAAITARDRDVGRADHALCGAGLLLLSR